MPAGDMLTGAFWEHEINGYLIGDDNPWNVDSVNGWIGHTVRDQDTALDLADGAVAATDTEGVKVVTLSIYTNLGTDSDSDTMEAFADLEAAWTIGADVELHATLPYYGHVYVVGRCRDLTPPDLRDVPSGRIEVQAMFVAHDPTVTVVTP